MLARSQNSLHSKERMARLMSAVYPSDEPDEEDNPNELIDEIIDRIIR